MNKTTQVPPEDIHTSPNFEKVEENNVENDTLLEAQTSDNNDVSNTVHPKYKTVKKKASVNFSEPIKTDRPKNVYIELIDGEYWLWYNTERSQEIGIARNFNMDDRTQVKSEYGYDCNIPATKENIELLKKETFAGTNIMFKDGVRRTLIPDIDEFMKKIKQ